MNLTQLISRIRVNETRVQQAAILAVLFFLIIGAYAVLAVMGAAPAAPWSPIGKVA